MRMRSGRRLGPNGRPWLPTGKPKFSRGRRRPLPGAVLAMALNPSGHAALWAVSRSRVREPPEAIHFLTPATNDAAKA